MFHVTDALRRARGRMMDAAGLGPVETPHRVVAERPGLRLRAYGEAAADRAGRAPLLIVPAPIKRPYIWDLRPEASVVRRCLDAGLPVYLAEWTDPGPDTADFGLAEYAGRLLDDALDAIASDMGGGKKGKADGGAVLAGHSLGGTLAAIYAAQRPQRVRGLVLVESPLHFGADSGDASRMVARAPHARRVRGAYGTVPGSFLTVVSVAGSPEQFVWSVMRDRLTSAGDPEARRTHAAVIRWTLDEFPMPGRLFEEVVEGLYREDRFFRGTLEVAGRTLGPRDLTVPVLTVVNPDSTLIPPDSVLPFLAASGAAETRVLHYHGDRGVAVPHVGPLVGRSAHEELWPEILRWIAVR